MRRSRPSPLGEAAAGQPVFYEVGPVSGGPAIPAAAARHAHTAFPLAPPGLRVVTYNILADQYASREFAQQHLFAYCPKQYAPWDDPSLHCIVFRVLCG